MTNLFKTASIAAFTVLLLTGCVSMSAVPANAPFQAEAAFAVKPTSSWTRMPNAMNRTTGSALTKDGVPLGAVYLLTVKNDKSMIDSAGKSKNLPRFTQGSTPLEDIDFLKASMSLMGFSDVNALNVRAEDIDGQSGTRLELEAKYPNGLNMRGDAALVETDDGLNVVLFVAPIDHYYSKYEADAKVIISSIVLD